MNTMHSVSNTSRIRSSEAVAVCNSFSFRSWMLRVMLVMMMVVGGKVAWGQVVSGRTYETKVPNSMPTGWTTNASTSSNNYLMLTYSNKYIQTCEFCQNGFTRIVLKARTYGGPSNAQALITVSWYDATTSAETVLGTITPTGTSLSNYTISSLSNPTANTNGYIKIQCKGASSNKGSGVSEVTITYTSGTCGTTYHSLSYEVSPTGSGTVTLGSTSVAEGSTTTAEANSNTGYEFSYWSISGSGASLSNTSTNRTTVTMGTTDAVVTAHFTEIPKYTVLFNAGDTGDGSCDVSSIKETVGGGGIVLPEATFPAICDPAYTFYGWTATPVSETNITPTIVGTVNDRYYPEEDNITLYAVYVSYYGDYEKVTCELSNWSGMYLIVYDDGNKVFDGSLETIDIANNYVDVTITNGTIVSDDITDESSFIIAKSGESYTIKSSSGLYIGQTSDNNGLLASPSAQYANSISYYDSGNSIDIVSGGAYLRYNSSSNQMRFRYYKSTTFTSQQRIQLYRKSAIYNTNPLCISPTTATITYDGNGATSGSVPVDDSSPYDIGTLVTVLDKGNLIKTGHTFAGWNTAADGSGTSYLPNREFTITENITLYAQWTPNQYIVAWYANGSLIESIPIDYGKSFLDDGYEIDGLEYLDGDAEGNACDEMHFVGWSEERFDAYEGAPTLLQYYDIVGIEVTDNKNYHAVFAKVTPGTSVTWNLVENVSELNVNDSIIIVSGDYALGTTQNTNNRDAVGITNNGDDVEFDEYDEVQIIKLEEGSAANTFSFFVGDGYLYAASSSKNYLRTEEELDEDDNGSWLINIVNGETTVEAQGTNTRNKLRKNSSSALFACYSSDQDAVSIYKKYGEGDAYSNYTTFCPCDYGLVNLSDGDMVWAGKNGPTNQWNLASNWVVYHTSDSKYHLTNEAPSNCNVYVKYVNDEGGCIINVSPLLTTDVTCDGLTLNGINLNIAENQTLTINGAATFTSGIINGDVIFGEDATVSGTSTSSHVNGVVTKNGTANGFTFPTGNNGNLGKVEVTNDVSDVSVQYFSNPAGFSANDLPRWWASASVSGFDHVSNVEYWKISSNEAITADFVAEASTDMHFNSETAEEDRMPANIQMAFYDNNRWTNVGGSASISDNTLTITGAEIPASATRGISGNYTTFGSKSKSTVLPIELVSFTANCNGRSALIEWTTATEKNNDFFVLEHSHDAVNFKEIARIASAGNSIEPISYAYTDYGVRNGDNYYRLVQVDYDGTSTASEIIVANCLGTDGEPEVLAYPNPFGDDLTLHFENFGNMQATVEVYDMLGRMVHTQKVNCSQNDYEVVLRLAGLSDGTYNVRVSTKEFVINRQVIKN